MITRRDASSTTADAANQLLATRRLTAADRIAAGTEARVYALADYLHMIALLSRALYPEQREHIRETGNHQWAADVLTPQPNGGTDDVVPARTRPAGRQLGLAREVRRYPAPSL